nr:MAG TPA: hypothetical protein [Caudoviricetes sp.]
MSALHPIRRKSILSKIEIAVPKLSRVRTAISYVFFGSLCRSVSPPA